MVLVNDTITYTVIIRAIFSQYCLFRDRSQVKMAIGLLGATQVLVTRPVEEVHERGKEHAPIHPPLEMVKTVKEVI